MRLPRLTLPPPARPALLGAALAAVAVAAAGGASAAANAAGCPPAGARTLAKGRSSIVYSTRSPGAPGRPRISACLRRGGKPVTLIGPHAPTRTRPRLGAVAIAGTLVAYVKTQTGIDSEPSDVEVVDIASRRVLRSFGDVTSYTDRGVIRDGRVTALAVVSPDGAVGWISERGGHGRPKTLSVYAAPPSQPAALVDEGADIGAESLRLGGRTLSWRHGASVRTAAL